jgi:hypothetical protein
VKISYFLVPLGALLCLTRSSASDPLLTCGSRSQGLAGARVMLADRWSGLGNPAGMAELDHLSFSLFYENCYILPETGVGALAISKPTRSGTFSINCSSFGYSQYRESRIALSYGKPLGRKIRAGIALHYLKIRQAADFGNLSALIPSLGIQVLPLQNLILGLQVFNPAGQHYVPSGLIDLPLAVQGGFGCQFGQELFICAEVEKRSRESLKCRGGIEISLHQQLTFRLGITSGVFPEYSIGLGVLFQSVTMDIAVMHHPVLGFNPSVTFSFNVEPVNLNKL